MLTTSFAQIVAKRIQIHPWKPVRFREGASDSVVGFIAAAAKWFRVRIEDTEFGQAIAIAAQSLLDGGRSRLV